MNRNRFLKMNISNILVFILFFSMFGNAYGSMPGHSPEQNEEISGLGSVTGTVYGPHDVPVGGASITVIGAVYFHAVTNASGEYSIPDVPAGSYAIQAAKTGYITGMSSPFVVSADETSVVDLFFMPQNMLVNGGYETLSNGVPAHWTAITGWHDSLIRSDTEAAHSGDRGVFLSSEQNTNPWINQMVYVDDLVTYDISYWYKAIDVQGSVGLKVEYYTEVQKTAETALPSIDAPRIVETSGDWKQFHLQTQAPEGAKVAYVYARLYGKGELYVDDASMTFAKPRPAVSLTADQIFYYSDISDGNARMLLYPNDDSFEDKTVNVQIRHAQTGTVIEEVYGLPAASEVNYAFHPDLMELQEGYEVTATLTDSEERVLGQDSTTIYRWDRPTMMNEQGELLVNGNPFYPVIGYHVYDEDYPLMADIGVNTVQGWLSNSESAVQTMLDQAQASGLKMLVPLYYQLKVKENYDLMNEFVNAFKDHPALLGWMIMDEPDVRKIPLEDLIGAYKIIRSIDAVHPTYMVVWDVQLFSSYGRVPDMLATDVYPLNKRPITTVGDYVRAAKEAVGGKRPVIDILQAFQIASAGYPYLPTITDVRNMAYQSLLAGAQGAGFYSVNDPGWRLMDSALWPGLLQFREEWDTIAALSRSDKTGEGTSNDIEWATWDWNGAEYVVALNESDEARTLSVPLGHTGYLADPLYDGQPTVFTATYGHLDIALDPLQTKVYRVTPFDAMTSHAASEADAGKSLSTADTWTDLLESSRVVLQGMGLELAQSVPDMNEVVQDALQVIGELNDLKTWVEGQDEEELGGDEMDMLALLAEIASGVNEIAGAYIGIDMELGSGEMIIGGTNPLQVTVSHSSESGEALTGGTVTVQFPDSFDQAPLDEMLGTLAAGGSQTTEHSFQVLGDVPAGAYPITVTVDFQYGGTPVKITRQSVYQAVYLLESAVSPSILNLNHDGSTPFSIQLTSRAEEEITVDLVHSSPGGLTVDLTDSMAIASQSTKTATGHIVVDGSTTDGTHVVQIQLKMNDELYATLPLTVSVDRNLIPNPGLEVGNSSQDKANLWTMGTSGWDGLVAHSGDYSGVLHEDSGNANNILMSARVPVTAGKTYAIKGWVKNNSTAGNVTLSARFVNAAGGTVAYSTAMSAVKGSDWTAYEQNAVAPANATAVQVYFKMNQLANGAAWLDDVYVRELP